jgi:hypothetical protein
VHYRHGLLVYGNVQGRVDEVPDDKLPHRSERPRPTVTAIRWNSKAAWYAAHPLIVAAPPPGSIWPAPFVPPACGPLPWLAKRRPRAYVVGV